MTTPSIQSLNGHLTQLNAILDTTNIKDTECIKVKEYLLENFKYIYAGRQYAVSYRNPDKAELLQHSRVTSPPCDRGIVLLALQARQVLHLTSHTDEHHQRPIHIGCRRLHLSTLTSARRVR